MNREVAWGRPRVFGPGTRPALREIVLEARDSFISGCLFDDLTVCDRMIEFFDTCDAFEGHPASSPPAHGPMPNEQFKDSLDLHVDVKLKNVPLQRDIDALLEVIEGYKKNYSFAFTSAPWEIESGLRQIRSSSMGVKDDRALVLVTMAGAGGTGPWSQRRHAPFTPASSAVHCQSRGREMLARGPGRTTGGATPSGRSPLAPTRTNAESASRRRPESDSRCPNGLKAPSHSEVCTRTRLQPKTRKYPSTIGGGVS